jgi:hypothetical protein
MLSALRGHIIGLNRDKCVFCKAKDVTTSHYPSCRALAKRTKDKLKEAWRTILLKTKIPPGFWRLSPQPPWPAVTIIPEGWREFNDTSNSMWLVQGSRHQHEFIPPTPESLKVTPPAMAAVAAMWPDREPLESLQALQYPAIMPSPALKASLPGDMDLPRLFKLGVRTTAQAQFWTPVHPSWYWAFQFLSKSGNKITMTQITTEMIVAILFKDSNALSFLAHGATDLPPWEEAVKDGHEETVIFGDLGAHSNLYPVALEDVLHMRQQLSQLNQRQ